MAYNFTHAFIGEIPDENGIKGIFVKLDDLENYLPLVYGFYVTEGVKDLPVCKPEFGSPWRQIRNSGLKHSFGHIQHGYICAGAGGLNSMKIQPTRERNNQ